MSMPSCSCSSGTRSDSNRSKSPSRKSSSSCSKKMEGRSEVVVDEFTEAGDSDLDSSGSLKVTKVSAKPSKKKSCSKSLSSSSKSSSKSSRKSSGGDGEKKSSKRSSIKNLLTGNSDSSSNNKNSSSNNNNNNNKNNNSTEEKSKSCCSSSNSNNSSRGNETMEPTVVTSSGSTGQEEEKLENPVPFPSTRGLSKLERTTSRNSLDGISFAEKLGLAVSPTKKAKKKKSRKAKEADESLVNKPGSDRTSEYYMVSGCSVLSRPIAFVDLLDRVNKLRLPSGQTPKSIVTATKHKRKRTIKAVSFATDMLTNNVWEILKEFERVDLSSQANIDHLWWSEEDFDERYEQDQEVAAFIHNQYAPLLREAYKSTKTSRASNAQLSPSMVLLDMQQVALCSMARGLEPEVIPKVRDLIVVSHCRAILKLQLMTDDCEELRTTSLKYSRPSRLMALKMAEFDEIQAQSIGRVLAQDLR